MNTKMFLAGLGMVSASVLGYQAITPSSVNYFELPKYSSSDPMEHITEYKNFITAPISPQTPKLATLETAGALIGLVGLVKKKESK